MRRKEEPSYQGTFTGARRYVMETFANTTSAMMKKRVSQFMLSTECSACHGKRLKPEALSVKFAGMDIADMARVPLKHLAMLMRPYCDGKAGRQDAHPEKAIVVQRIAQDLSARLGVLLDLGLGYLTLERSTPTLSPGELQRLRLATQVRSNLFGVVYVLDEPSAGLHPSDTEALLRALDRLKAAGNSLFVVEHELDVVRHADWIVDVGPDAGRHGGEILYSGPADGLKPVERSPGVDGVLATQSAPLAESVNVMSVNVPPTSIARVQVLATGAPIVDPPLAPEKTALASQPRSRLLHFSRADSSGADFRARRRFVV